MHQKGKSEQDSKIKLPAKKPQRIQHFVPHPSRRADDAWTGMRYIDGTLMESSPDATGRVLLKQPQRPPSDERETSPPSANLHPVMSSRLPFQPSPEALAQKSLLSDLK
ncbi:hypothetical protein CDAR_68161 [Caerostris darwini]|uniref:Uncharacterized protein n=1 Tax=Caerostris darwini TaxID=1538125 RepID=A0AAV4VTM5_9ARAC|nr:hypothetical protein CDAR_68161 [Caerostris darwini]